MLRFFNRQPRPHQAERVGQRGGRRQPAPFHPRLEPLEDRQLLSVYVVTTTSDSAAAGSGSLRRAILDANQHPGPDTIQFDIEGVTPLIQPTAPLPTLADPVFIDGTSQPGWYGNPVVSLDGTNAGTNASGLTTSADGCTVRGLTISHFAIDGILLNSSNNVVAGNFISISGQDGLVIRGGGNRIGGLSAALDANAIRANVADGILLVGTQATGNVIEGNSVESNRDGIVLVLASGNTIGGAGAGAGNLVSLNNGLGIRIDQGSNANQVLGNVIGTLRSGRIAQPNSAGGVAIMVGASENVIGGSTSGARNIISGNGGNGIELMDAVASYPGDLTVSGNVIAGNYIGVDLDGKTALPNAGNGITLSTGAGGSQKPLLTGNVIGGTTAAARNVISGNGGDGIELSGAQTTGNLIQGNYIGTTAAGDAALPNQSFWGVEVFNGASGNTVGGTVAGAGNLISGNAESGIYLHDDGTSGNVIQGNRIGTDASGTRALPNAAYGVALWFGATGNLVGGTSAGAGNLISGNGNSGIDLRFPGTNGNVVQGNKIGTDVSGTHALGNGGAGVSLYEAGYNTMGGTDPGAGNLISGNAGQSIDIQDASGPAAPPGFLPPPLTLTPTGTALGFSLSTFAYQFPNRFDGLGALGTAIPASGGVLVSDGLGNVYHFPTDNDGYVASEADQTTTYGGVNGDGGLARLDGKIYLALASAHELAQVKDDGTFIQPVVDGNGNPLILPNPVGIVADPLTHHLFVSCYPSTIFDVDPVAGTATVLGDPNIHAVGLAFDPASNILFAADPDFGGHVLGFNAATGALVFDAGAITGGRPEGVAVGAGSLAGNLFVNTATGYVVEVNLGSKFQTVLASGGSYGSLVSVDANSGSLLITQTDRVVRLRPPGGGNFVGGDLTTTAGGTPLAFTLTAQADAAGFTVSTFATGFPQRPDHLGPMGVGFTRTNQVLVSDIDTGSIYLLSDTDGQNVTGVTPTASYGFNQAEGIARSGNTLYLARGTAGRIDAITDETGLTEGTISLPAFNGVAANPAGIVANPRNGHLFVSNYQGPIYEVDPLSKTVTLLANLHADGLAFDPSNGVLYAALYADAANEHVVGLDARTDAVVFDSGTLGTRTTIGDVTGVAVGTSLLAGNLFVNTTGGYLFEINLATKTPTLLASGGSRGDLLTVDPITGTLLVTQSDRILRLFPGTGGAFVGGSLATGNVVQGNLIGTDGTGIAALPNQGGGILLSIHASGNVVGGMAAGAGNVIAGNDALGLWLLGAGTVGNAVQGNFIGTNAAGAALGNGGPGVLVSAFAAANALGGAAANTIAFNSSGVVLDGTAGPDNVIQGNSIHDNSVLGIDLGYDGVTANEARGHFGPNLFQDFPVLSAATVSGGSGTPVQLTVSGMVSGPAQSTLTVQIFANPTPMGNFAEGRVLLGTTTATTGTDGTAGFTVALPGPPPSNYYLTATATDAAGNTSEFSAPLPVQAADLAITQTASPNPVPLGGTLTYTITVTNHGPLNSPGLQVGEVLPFGATLVSAAAPATVTVFPGFIVFAFGSLPVGQSVTATVVVRPTAVGLVTSQTTGTVDNFVFLNGNSFDPNSADNSSVLTTTVTLTPDQAFVAQAYHDLLQRPAGGGEIALWVSVLENPDPQARGSRAAVAQGIEGSDEYRALVVEALYHQLLRRAASDDASHSAGTEVGTWLGQFRSAPGFSEKVLEADILGSQEYFGQRGGLSNGGFLMAVYQDVLGRPLDAGAAQVWTRALQDPAWGPTPDARRTAVALAILNSPESDMAEVEGLYRQFLHRDAESGGLNAFTNALEAGESLEVARAAIVGSDEYFMRL